MSKAGFITGLDIGTQNIKILVVQKKEDGVLDVVYQGQEPASGVKRGVVVNPEEVSDVLQRAFAKIKEETGLKIDSAYVNVDGRHIFSMPSKGLISVSRADERISEEDIQRVIQAAQTVSFPSKNNEIVDVILREFIIDGEKGIKEALGLRGVRLEAEVLVLAGFGPYLENLNQTVLNADLQMLDRVPSSIAAARACLTPKQKELGVALVDVGAGTTSLAVFEDGDLMHLAVLPIGSSNITNDIAISLKTDIDVAEKIKIDYGSCQMDKAWRREKIKIGDNDSLVFSRKQVVDIVQDRVSEIFGEINRELKKISRENSLPSGIVFTGGGVKLPKILDLAKKEFKLPLRIGKPQGVAQQAEDLSWSTCCGLVLLGSDMEGGGESAGGRLKSGFLSKIKKIFKTLVP
ncbi:MAG: cell division protein FtsA [bacterium]